MPLGIYIYYWWIFVGAKCWVCRLFCRLLILIAHFFVVSCMITSKNYQFAPETKPASESP